MNREQPAGKSYDSMASLQYDCPGLLSLENNETTKATTCEMFKIDGFFFFKAL